MMISSLSQGSIFTPNHYTGRAYAVTKVTIHEMAAVWSAQRCGEFFRDSTSNASSNYGIGNAGDIMCYVDENNAAWTSSSWDNDNRAITIEVSNSSMDGDWPISDSAYKSLVKLCADICNRYYITPEYNGTPNASFTEHRMFANTACPGPYIHNLLESGKLINDIKAAMKTEGWVKDSKGWWYREADGSWPANKWKKISGKWYYFGKDGYMKTGWVWWQKKWYYCADSGEMISNTFRNIKGNWYAFDKSGAMIENINQLQISKEGVLSIVKNNSQ